MLKANSKVGDVFTISDAVEVEVVSTSNAKVTIKLKSLKSQKISVSVDDKSTLNKQNKG